MSSQYADTLEKNWLVGGGTDALVYHVTPIIVVKSIRANRKPEKEGQEHPFDKEIAFYKSMREHQDRCQDIVQCFLILPDYLFLSYCEYRSLGFRLGPHQEREVT
ncbi:TK/ABL protein kinase [Penicillium malachiteum]|nr:TK/ABL protein kinase [Penicillium malachiteum]